MTQPAVTFQIKQLEEYFNARRSIAATARSRSRPREGSCWNTPAHIGLSEEMGTRSPS